MKYYIPACLLLVSACGDTIDEPNDDSGISTTGGSDATGTGGSEPSTGGSEPSTGGSEPMSTGGSEPMSTGGIDATGGTEPSTGGTSERVCTPGATQRCTGLSDAGVCDGVQTCSQAGDTWEACQCASGGTGGTGGTGGEPSHTSTFVTGGLGESGTWKGYLFTAAGYYSTIMPAEFDGSEICASGSLPADYEEWALIGWNIAQVIDETTFAGGAVNAVAPGGAGVAYDIQNEGGSGLRIFLFPDEAATTAWCADVPSNGGTGVIPWGDFTKECWEAGGAAYDGTTPIAQVAVQTYASNDITPTPFDFCVITLGPA